jgi:phosphatidylglycerophosphate synthase
MIGVRRGLVAAVLGLLALLLLVPGTGAGGTALGAACAVVLAAAAAHRAREDGVETLGPADLVTVARAVLACCVAALVGESLLTGARADPVVVPLTVVALALDFVDGRVARHTGTASAFGARLDGEADAFLILVLSAYVARDTGAWVLAMGAVRYAYAAATWALPWMQRPLPPRHWRKVVAAVTGIALALAASGLAPHPASLTAVVVAALLLAESFGWDVVWLWRRRPARVNRTGAGDVLPVRTPERNR